MTIKSRPSQKSTIAVAALAAGGLIAFSLGVPAQGCGGMPLPDGGVLSTNQGALEGRDSDEKGEEASLERQVRGGVARTLTAPEHEAQELAELEKDLTTKAPETAAATSATQNYTCPTTVSVKCQPDWYTDSRVFKNGIVPLALGPALKYPVATIIAEGPDAALFYDPSPNSSGAWIVGNNTSLGNSTGSIIDSVAPTWRDSCLPQYRRDSATSIEGVSVPFTTSQVRNLSTVFGGTQFINSLTCRYTHPAENGRPAFSILLAHFASYEGFTTIGDCSTGGGTPLSATGNSTGGDGTFHCAN